MANISAIKLPNGDTYNLIDKTSNFLTDHQTIKTLHNKTLTGSGNVTLSCSDIGAATSGHTHTTSITATPNATNALTLEASTKYTLTAGETTYVFTTPPNTTYDAGSNITLTGTTFSLTKANVTGALGYTPPTTNTTYTFDGTYNASTNKAATVSTVTNAINTLDGTVTGTAGKGNTITSLSQTDGKITATFDSILITKSQISDFPSSMPPSAHTHNNIVTEGDNRSVATTPNDYSNKIIFKGLKSKTTIDSPSNDNYSYLIGLRGWSDSSGGNSHEIAFNNTGVYLRNGATTTWGSWARIYTTANKPTASDVGALPSTATYADVGAAPSTHSHNYAGSSSAGGAATNAATTVDTSNTLYAVGVTSAATTTLKRNTSVTFKGGTVTATTFSGSLDGTASGNLTSSSTLNPANLDGVGSGTTKFLREDGTWVKPAYTTNTDTKVNVIARGTTKAYLLGTTTAPTASNQAVSSVAETGVYFDTSAAKLVATTFVGNLTGTASGNLTASSSLNAAKLTGTVPSSCYTDTTYTFDGTYNASTNKAATVKTVTDAINALDGGTIGDPGSGKTITAISQTNGNISVSFGDISITKSQITDFPTSMTPSSHSHGNISNGGDITATAPTIASGDQIIINDDSANKITNGPTFDGSTTTKALTPKGTWETFLQSHQAHQTIKQDGVTGATGNHFGSCTTAAGTAAKTVSITAGTPALETGLRVTVKFSNANTAGTPTLNVNGLGAKNIFHKGAQITTGSNKALLAGTVEFVYDGTQWQLVGNYIDTNTTYTLPTQANNATTGITASTTANKTTVGSHSTDYGVKAAGSGNFTQGAFTGGSGTFKATVTNHVLAFEHTHTAATHAADTHTHTAPTLGSKVPTVITASATVSITDNGHTHTLS